MKWYPTTRLLTYCEVDAYYFPFDHHQCNITISNLVSPTVYTNFTPIPNLRFVSDRTIISNEWTLIDAKVVNNPIENSVGMLYSSIDFVLTVKRTPTYYVLMVILPVALLSCVSVMVFPLPADSGEKLSLSLSCLMSFFITQLSISEQMPTGFRATPVLGKETF